MFRASKTGLTPPSPHPTVVVLGGSSIHYENKPIQIYWKFYEKEMKIFR